MAGLLEQRIAALQNLQPYTGSQITWPKLWGNMTPLGQTPEGYAVVRQPGGDMMLANPNTYSGKSNNLMDMQTYLATGGQSGWSEDGAFRPVSASQQLRPYQVGIDANNGQVYDFGNGQLMGANGNTPFNSERGGSINPVAPGDAYDPAKGYDAAKMKAAGYEYRGFGGSEGNGMGAGGSMEWVKNVNGRLIGPDGREIDAANGLTGKTPYAYAGKPPIGSDFAWGANSDEQRNYFNRDASTAYNYQPQQRAQPQQQAQPQSVTPYGGQGMLNQQQFQWKAPQQAQQAQPMPSQANVATAAQSMNPFFQNYWGSTAGQTGASPAGAMGMPSSMVPKSGIQPMYGADSSTQQTPQAAWPQYEKQFQQIKQMPQAAPQQIRGAPPLYDPNDPTLREPTIGEYAAQRFWGK